VPGGVELEYTQELGSLEKVQKLLLLHRRDVLSSCHPVLSFWSSFLVKMKFLQSIGLAITAVALVSAAPTAQDAAANIARDLPLVESVRRFPIALFERAEAD
jgi:hypothetical protein